MNIIDNEVSASVNHVSNLMGCEILTTIMSSCDVKNSFKTPCVKENPSTTQNCQNLKPNISSKDYIIINSSRQIHLTDTTLKADISCNSPSLKQA